jgi:AmmeMemoRadiSam system protein B
MSAAKAMGMREAKVINHTNSGDVTSDYSSVVSYYAIGFR